MGLKANIELRHSHLDDQTTQIIDSIVKECPGLFHESGRRLTFDTQVREK